MLEKLLEFFDGGDGDDRNRGRPNRAARHGGVLGFLGRLFGFDDEDDDEPRADQRGRRDRDHYANGDDDDDYGRGRGRRRDRDDDGGWFDLGD